MKRELTCIICPRGCALTVEGTEQDLRVSGHSCPKGEQYAIEECLHPVRTVTSTVRVSNRENTMVSVKTADPVPKEHIFDVMDCIRQLQCSAPIHIGDVLIEELYGTSLVATKDIM